jgi:hypothetical protein
MRGFWWKILNWDKFPRINSIFPCQYISTTTPHTYFTHLPPTPAGTSGCAVCGRSTAETVGSNPTEAWMPVASVVCCQVEVYCNELIIRPEESYLWCVAWVIYKPREWGGHGPMEGGRGAVAPKTNKKNKPHHPVLATANKVKHLSIYFCSLRCMRAHTHRIKICIIFYFT